MKRRLFSTTSTVYFQRFFRLFCFCTQLVIITCNFILVIGKPFSVLIDFAIYIFVIYSLNLLDIRLIVYIFFVRSTSQKSENQEKLLYTQLLLRLSRNYFEQRCRNVAATSLFCVAAPSFATIKQRYTRNYCCGCRETTFCSNVAETLLQRCCNVKTQRCRNVAATSLFCVAAPFIRNHKTTLLQRPTPMLQQRFCNVVVFAGNH